jgi:hypothetical protein
VLVLALALPSPLLPARWQHLRRHLRLRLHLLLLAASLNFPE